MPEVEDIWKTYDLVTYVLKAINLKVAESEVVLIKDLSGGKTLFNRLGILVNPRRARYWVMDIGLWSSLAVTRLRLGYEGQVCGSRCII